MTFERSFEPGEFYTPVGVGPHPVPWPTGEQFDPELLANGDRRNVCDEYRYLTVAAIRERLAACRSSVHVAIENWQHDLNIGSLVRTANAFNVAGVHIIGNKHWNQHGALMTDKYIEMHHHASATDFRSYTEQNSLQVIGFDNVPGAVALDHFTFPPNSVLLFGNEGTGLTPDAVEISDALVEITQYGSVRSMNASAAGAIALYAWMAQHRPSAS